MSVTKYQNELKSGEDKQSTTGTVAGSLATGGTLLGLTFLLDGLSPEGSTVAFTVTSMRRK